MKSLKLFLIFPLLIFVKKYSAGKRVRLITGISMLCSITVLLFIIAGCSYYKAATTKYPSPGDLLSLTESNKIFVVHSSTGVYILSHAEINKDSLRGTILQDYYEFPVKRSYFPEENTSPRYRPNKGDARILNEVHIYVSEGASPAANRSVIACADIYRCDVYNHNSGKTTAVGILSFFGVVASPFILLILILFFLIITGASCPYVYVNTPEGFLFAGEIYSGAIYKPLERDDYLPLPELVAEKGLYRIKISNELKEIQNTNLAELVLVDHPANIAVLFDKYGQCQTSSGPLSPEKAVNFTGKDVLKAVKSRDTLYYAGEDPGKRIPLTDGVILTFSRPENAISAKLFVRLRNSLWLDNVYQNFHSMLGFYDKTWKEKQSNGDPEEMKKWSLSQKIPLLVYIETPQLWQYCDYFNMTGPAVFRDDVLTLDISNTGKGSLRIKLESGSFFWEIDYVAVDYSYNFPVRIFTVDPGKAITEEGKDVSKSLKADDSEYYVQPDLTNVADISYPVPEKIDSVRTIFLHSKGYYVSTQDAGGFPRLRKLNKYRKPGQFLEYSRDLMETGLDSLGLRQSLKEQ
jgi:hypothetical protein